MNKNERTILWTCSLCSWEADTLKEWPLVKHIWLNHREEFPSNFTTLSQFMRWLHSKESKVWREKHYLIRNVARELEEIYGTPDDNVKPKLKSFFLWLDNAIEEIQKENQWRGRIDAQDKERFTRTKEPSSEIDDGMQWLLG